MNKFQEVKSILKNEEVVQKYLGLPEKRTSSGSWYKSPFRKEKTASFLVSNKGIHDFGDSTNYDIISFVEKYFTTTPKKALQILCNDFNLSLGNDYETREILERLKKKREEERLIREKVNNWYNTEIQRISNELIDIRRCIVVCRKKINFDTLAILYDEKTKLELAFEELFSARTEEEKTKMYLLSI